MMSTAQRQPKPGILDRLGMPPALFLGFVGVLIFLIGDGVESNYLSPFLVDKERFSASAAAVTISLMHRR